MGSSLGNVAFPDMHFTKPYGERVESLIDAEIKKVIEECTKKTKSMVREH